MEDKFVVLYSDNRFILSDVGLSPFKSVEEANERIKYFQENRYMKDAKTYKLVEI